MCVCIYVPCSSWEGGEKSARRNTTWQVGRLGGLFYISATTTPRAQARRRPVVCSGRNVRAVRPYYVSHPLPSCHFLHLQKNKQQNQEQERKKKGTQNPLFFPMHIHLFLSLSLSSPSFSPSPPSIQNQTIWLSMRMLSIMTSRPMVTMMSRVKENQPRTMALVPTPARTAPLPKSSAMVLAATEAVCCHRTETSTKMDAMKMMARAIWETGRLGKGLTSRSEPKEPSSSCQPGKVARRRKQMKAKMMAMILLGGGG